MCPISDLTSRRKRLYSASWPVLDLLTPTTGHAIVRQLLDVVNEAVPASLRVDFRLAAQREAVQSLVVPDVAKRRLDRADALAIQCLTTWEVQVEG